MAIDLLKETEKELKKIKKLPIPQRTAALKALRAKQKEALDFAKKILKKWS